jgi:hypothetical protein
MWAQNAETHKVKTGGKYSNHLPSKISVSCFNELKEESTAVAEERWQYIAKQ